MHKKYIISLNIVIDYYFINCVVLFLFTPFIIIVFQILAYFIYLLNMQQSVNVYKSTLFYH